MTITLFDGLLVLAIVVLAGRAVTDPDLFRAAVQFVAMGLLMALAWVRLRAPDVALAEAAVGSALTGALVLSALTRMCWRGCASRSESGAWRPGVGLLSFTLLLLVGLATRSLPGSPVGLTREALAALPESGVTNPVTAALLNYRGYDTLLEVAVFLLAVIGVWSLDTWWTSDVDVTRRPALGALLRLVLPTLVVASGYLLWIGSSAPGGAFQGGALIGGAGILALLAGLGRGVSRHERLLRSGLALGLVVFVAIAAGVMVRTGRLLEYPAGSAGTLILAIESAALVSIGLTLAALYLGGRPAASESPHEPHD